MHVFEKCLWVEALVLREYLGFDIFREFRDIPTDVKGDKSGYCEVSMHLRSR